MLLPADGPLITERDVVFRVRVADAPRAVRLCQELARPRIGPDLAAVAGGRWELRWPRGGVDRMEYRFQVVDRDGRVSYPVDPGNRSSAPGAFGDRSVVEFPGYRQPGWLDRPPGPTGTVRDAEIACARLAGRMAVRLWSPPGAGQGDPLPLLVAHDGPDYARYAGLIRLLERLGADGRLPRLRAALLRPVDRDEHYAASPAYARTLVEEVLPALARLAPAPAGSAPVGVGASLGALALLHAQRTAAAPFAGLFLQSGSYFVEPWDAHESSFARFDRVTAFVRTVLDGPAVSPSVPVVLTCGSVEENLANNQAVAAALAAQGHPVELHLHRDAHNWVSWRDVLDPHLVALTASCWG